MRSPLFYQIRQAVSAPALEDVAGSVRRALEGSSLAEKIAETRPAKRSEAARSRIAVTAGSRGIANIPLIIRTVVDYVRECGGDATLRSSHSSLRSTRPFIVPAMGSHGGATAEGQTATLADLGITEESVGAPVLSSMETVVVGKTGGGVEVRMDKHAAGADGIVVVGRIKPHTDFSGPIESGLCKMLAIGLGKHDGALLVHSYGPQGLREMVPETAEVILQSAPVLVGLAIIENSAAQTAYVEAVEPADFAKRDHELLPRAKEWSPRLPFDELDILIIRWMGKDVSGTGIDTKVVGRLMDWREPDPEKPNIGTIGVLDLTPGSHGNAVGIGLADLTTQRLVDKIDRHATQTNAVTARSISRAKTPCTLATDRELFEVALTQVPADRQSAAPAGRSRTAGEGPRPSASSGLRIAIIQDTQHLEVLHISEALLPEAQSNENVTVERGPLELEFAADGSLAEFAA